MTQFWAFVKKEFFHVFRDRKTLLMLFGVPISQIVLFGFALSNEVKNSKIVVADYARDNASQRIIQKFEASDEFKIKKSLKRHGQLEAAFKKGDVRLAVVIPENFEKDLRHQNEVQIELIADAINPNRAQTLKSYATRIIQDYQQELMQTQNAPLQINPEIRMVYNPSLESNVQFVPGVIAIVLLIICVLMTSVSIAREKETGTMEVLLVSPFNPFMVIISKAIPYLALSLVNLTVILVLSVYVLGMPLNGSLLLLYGVSTIFIITALSLGLLISNISKTQETAMLLSLLGMLMPALILTGFAFPLENMPVALQITADFLPSRWYYTIIKSIMVKGLGLAAIWKETLILIGMAVVLLVLSVKQFKIRLE